MDKRDFDEVFDRLRDIEDRIKDARHDAVRDRNRSKAWCETGPINVCDDGLAIVALLRALTALLETECKHVASTP